MWSSIGSGGVVDVGDLTKVVFGGSVAQLGHGIGGIAVTRSTIARAISLPQTTATIRYAVPEDGFQGTAVGVWRLQMRYRTGTGRVSATLMEVDLGVVIVPSVIGPVVETPLLMVESAVPSGDEFVTYYATATPRSDQAKHVFDFNNHAYYVVVTLSGEEIVVGYPPAISTIGLFLA
jgi:hypothetical protein